MKFFLILYCILVTNLLANSYSTDSNWLEVTPDEKKFKAIQTQLRGFDLTMQEVGVRYESIREAIKSENYELASYHWDKIKTSIENGIIRRPAREKSSKAYLLDTFWDDFDKKLQTKDKNSISKSFDKIKNICNSCHKNQNVDFIQIN